MSWKDKLKSKKDPIAKHEDGYRLDCENFKAECTLAFKECYGCPHKPIEKPKWNRLLEHIAEALYPGCTLRSNKHYSGTLFKVSPAVAFMIHMTNIWILLFGLLNFSGVDIYIVDVGASPLSDSDPMTLHSNLVGGVCMAYLAMYYIIPRGWIDRKATNLGKAIRRKIGKND